MSSGVYEKEVTLVDTFCDLINSKDAPWGQLKHSKEFDYSRGRTDVIAVDKNGKVLAFEMKLKKWTKAMQQAYKNTCFAHLSYVVLPERIAKLAIKSHHEFCRRSVGICSVSDNEITVMLSAKRQNPIQPWLSEKATNKVLEGEASG